MLVSIGSAVASLLAYLAMDRWLQGFAYRTWIGPIRFLVAAAGWARRRPTLR